MYIYINYHVVKRFPFAGVSLIHGTVSDTQASYISEQNKIQRIWTERPDAETVVLQDNRKNIDINV